MSPDARDEASSPAVARAEPQANLLDRPLPAGYREEWARHFAGAEERGSDGDESDQETVVVFRIGDEWLALAIGLFHEVTEPMRPHSLPHRRDKLVLGIVNVRGEILVCVSMADLLGLGEARTVSNVGRIKTFARMVVIGRNEQRVAFPVDEVHGIHHYTSRDVGMVPATLAKSASSFTTAMIGWQGRSIGRLDDTLILEALDRGIA